MKKTIFGTILVASLLSTSALATVCATPFSGAGNASVQLPAAVKWRDTQTHVNANGSVAETTAAREKKLQATAQEMYSDVMYSSATPLMEFFPASKVKTKVVFESGGYGTGEVTKIQVGDLGGNGVLEGTLLLPVSGHLGPESARKWSTTDTYSIIIEEGGRQKTLISNVKSLDIVTVQELQIPLVKGQNVRILYHRSGSAGPYGFIEGRALDIVWDGT